MWQTLTVLLFVAAIAAAQTPQPKDSATWLQIDWEREKFEKRIPTDTIVIHHTSAPPDMTWQELSELQRRTVYVPRYTGDIPDPWVKGQEPRSGHFRYVDGVLTEVFYTYHFLVRPDGKVAERLLADTEIGWHAGNWNENMRSVAICFDGDYSAQAPPEAAMRMAAGVIADYCKRLPIKRLLAHYQTNKRTSCPGNWFGEKGPDGLTGRERLLKMAGVTLASE